MTCSAMLYDMCWGCLSVVRACCLMCLDAVFVTYGADACWAVRVLLCLCFCLMCVCVCVFVTCCATLYSVLLCVLWSCVSVCPFSNVCECVVCDLL